MKVLFLTPGCFDKGGISRYSRYQINALRETFDPLNVRAISLLGPEPDGFEEKFPIYWHADGNSLLDKIKFTLKVIWVSIRWRPDYIHVAHVNLSGLVKLVAGICTAKVVLNVYGLEVWSNLSRDAAFGLRKADYLISDCHNTANYVEKKGFRNKGSTTIIWDCVDIEKFKPFNGSYTALEAKYKLPDRNHHFITLTLGRLAKGAAHKGYDRLIQVFSQVHKKHPKSALVIAGKGDLTHPLTLQAEALGVADHVHFTGMVHEDDLAALYSYAHVFSLVSDQGEGRGEGIPLTPLEAMACGTPIIVGNEDGSREAIFGSKNGFVIDPFDLETHEKKINALVENEDLLQSMSKEALHISRDVFSFDQFLQKHKDFYKRILNE